MMLSLLLLFTLVLSLLLIPVIRDFLLILLILGLLTILVIVPWFAVSPGQIAPLPAVTAIPIPVTPAPPWTVPEIPNSISNSGD